MTISKKFIAAIFLAKASITATLLLGAPKALTVVVYLVVVAGSIISRRKIEGTKVKGFIARGYRDAKAALCSSVIFFSIGATMASTANGSVFIYLVAIAMAAIYLSTLSEARYDIAFGKRMAARLGDDA